MQVDLAIKSKNIVTSSEIIDGMLLIGEGKILDIISSISYGEQPEINLLDFPISDVGDWVVMPGLINPHVQLSIGIPEIMDAVTHQAASGGITTVALVRESSVLNPEPVAGTISHIDYCFWDSWPDEKENPAQRISDLLSCGLSISLSELKSLSAGSGGFKQLAAVLSILQANHKPLLVYRAGMEQTPPKKVAEIIKDLIEAGKEAGARIHIGFIPDEDSLHQIETARKEGHPVSTQATPRSLHVPAEKNSGIQADSLQAGWDVQKARCLALWNALGSGILDMIATGTFENRSTIAAGDDETFARVLEGIRYSLPAVWTGALERNYSIPELLNWFCEKPAGLLGLSSVKGKIAKGFQADLCIWAPAEKVLLPPGSSSGPDDADSVHETELYGVVKQTYLGGMKIYSEGRLELSNKGSTL